MSKNPASISTNPKYLRYNHPLRSKLIWCLIFSIVLSIQLAIVHYLLHQKFSLFAFSIFMSWMIVLSYVTFILLRCVFCPLVQIYRNEIIISRFKRIYIPMDDIVEMKFHDSKIELSYRDNGLVRVLNLTIKPLAKAPISD